MELRNQAKKVRIHITTQRDMGRAKARVKRKRFQPVTKLFHTTVQGKHECTTQQEMSTACIIENKKRFSQTIDTPPMRTALIDRIGYDAEKEEGTQILVGTVFYLLGTPKYMQKVLDHLRKPRIVVHRGPISTLISTQENIQEWKNKKREQHRIRVN